MTMGVERTLRTSLNASSSREEDQFEESFSSRSKFILTAPFSELKEETFSFVDQVILCLTAEGELLVLKKTSEFPTRFSLVRKHDLRTSQIMEHPLLPDAMRVQAAGTVLVYVYQTVIGSSKSTLKKWISKVSACRAKSKDKRSANAKANTHSRNGSKVAKNGFLPKIGFGNKSKSTTTAEVRSRSSSHAYSSPSSPVVQHRSILSVALVSNSHLSSGNSLQEEEEEEEGEQLQVEEEPKELEEADSGLAEQNGSSCDIDDVVLITNGHGDEEEDEHVATPISFEATPSGSQNGKEKKEVAGEIVMLVNGHADVSDGTGNAVDGDDGDNVSVLDDDKSPFVPIDLAAYDEELDQARLSRDHRSSLRLDLKKSSEMTRTSSDRYLGHHRALSAIEEGAVLSTTFSRSSSSASKLDELKESGHLENGSVPHPQLNGETRSHGSSTPISPPLSPTTSRTPSPLTPVPPSSEGGEPFGRFHHIQIRNRKVKCSPRINRSISVQTPPCVEEASETVAETRSASLAESLANSLIVTQRHAEMNARR